MANFDKKILEHSSGFFLIRWTYHPHKNSQNCCHQTRFLGSKYSENAFGRGFAPDPNGGAYGAPPDPLAGFKGPLNGGREGEGRREGNKGEGREGEERDREERKG